MKRLRSGTKKQRSPSAKPDVDQQAAPLALAQQGDEKTDNKKVRGAISQSEAAETSESELSAFLRCEGLHEANLEICAVASHFMRESILSVASASSPRAAGLPRARSWLSAWGLRRFSSLCGGACACYAAGVGEEHAAVAHVR